MKNPFQPGDNKVFKTTVTADKLAIFEAGMVHPVYSTFSLGKDAEWASRLFVLEMKEEGEEGIGSHLTIEHVSPAPLGAEVEMTAILEGVSKNEVICSFEAKVGDRLIAKGKTIQKIINNARFDAYLESLLSNLS